MALFAKEGKKVDFTKDMPSPGQHVAICIGVWDIGWHESEWQGKVRMNHKVLFRWELDEYIEGGEYDGKHKTLNQRYNNTLGEKSKLREDLMGWRGKDLTVQEAKDGFDLETMIGQACMINVVHQQKGEKTYANLSSISGLFKGAPLFTPDNPWTGATPDWIAKIKAESKQPDLDIPDEIDEDDTPLPSSNEEVPPWEE